MYVSLSHISWFLECLILLYLISGDTLNTPSIQLSDTLSSVYHVFRLLINMYVCILLLFNKNYEAHAMTSERQMMVMLFISFFFKTNSWFIHNISFYTIGTICIFNIFYNSKKCFPVFCSPVKEQATRNNWMECKTLSLLSWDKICPGCQS